MRNKKREHDFAGWVTKNDIRCTDGVTIRHDAFKDSHGKQVPLVWNHDYNSPTNVLGHIELENRTEGVYGYGYLNSTQEGESARALISHGDISSMSIGARKIKRSGSNVIHGNIYEVSLVLAGANPGATIETFMQHGDNGEYEVAHIETGLLFHSENEEEENEMKIYDKDGNEIDINSLNLQHATATAKSETIGDVMETLTEPQKEAVYALLGSVVESMDEDDDDVYPDYDDEEGDEEPMKQNVFNKQANNNEENDILRHSMSELLKTAITNKEDSFRQVLDYAKEQDDTIKHGINSIEMLFPEAAHSTNGNVPILYKDPNTAYRKILDATSKSPFSRVRTLVADLTEEEARAKGYIKGTMKKEQFFSLIKRTTTPTTVYKKQKLDRDDIVDITDFDVVAFMNREMRMMLEEEIARAILVGDGRDAGSDDKINEENIRPVIKDNDFFVIRKRYTDAADFIEVVIKAMSEYRGSGVPTMYCDPAFLADIKLLKGTDNRFLFGAIPSTDAIAALLGVKEIVPTTFMIGKGVLVVNLSDYGVGSTKGGQITNFDDFDIDFNQYKYLTETRLSGALTMPKSAIHLDTVLGTGQTELEAGIAKGERQADKVTP